MPPSWPRTDMTICLLQLDAPSEILTQVIGVCGTSFRTIWLVMVAFAAISFVSSPFTKEVTIEKEELGRQRFEPSPEAAGTL
jgi:hypothetical protein